MESLQPAEDVDGPAHQGAFQGGRSVVGLVHDVVGSGSHQQLDGIVVAVLALAALDHEGG